MQTFQSGFETTLALRLDPSDTTATLASVPTVTKGRMYLDNGEQKEWIKFTGVSGSTITGLVRGLSQTADPATAGTGLTWIAGTKIKLVAMHDQMLDRLEGDDALISAVVYADTTARDAELGGDGVATINYTNIKTTADGLFWRYNTTTGVWEAIDTGTVTANASATVAGKVELATEAEGIAGTATGGTGASLDLTPDLIAKITQSGSWVYCASATGSDTYTANLTPSLTAYTTGMLLPCKFTTTNTGACSININSLGAKNIKTKDGNDPQTGVIRANGTALLMYDGTNFVIQSEDFATATVNGIMKSDFQKYNFFGDGSDGDVTISSNTTLASDKFYNNLTIDNGFTLNPGGYRIFVKGTLTNNGTIARNGNNGTNGGTSTSGTGGSALANGTIYGSAAGTTGSSWSNGSGGGNVAALGNGQGVAGGNGGAGATAGFTGGTVTQERIVAGLEDSTLNTFLFDNGTDTIKNTIVFKGLTSGYTMIGSGSGGGGGGNGSSSSGGGGGGGSAGGMVYISALSIVNAGTISSNGGNGGNGGNGSGTNGGGGGGGGGGGPVLLVYGTLSNSGSITSTGGSAGTGGTGTPNGANGTAGSSNAICKIVII